MVSKAIFQGFKSRAIFLKRNVISKSRQYFPKELTEYSVAMASYRKANSENGSPSFLGDFFTI